MALREVAGAFCGRADLPATKISRCRGISGARTQRASARAGRLVAWLATHVREESDRRRRLIGMAAAAARHRRRAGWCELWQWFPGLPDGGACMRRPTHRKPASEKWKAELRARVLGVV